MTDMEIANAVVSDANRLWWPIGIALFCFLTVLALKFRFPNPQDRKLRLPLVGFEVEARWIYALTLVFTLAHGFLAWHFLLRITEVVICKDEDLAKSVWYGLTAGKDAPPIFLRMEPRELTGDISIFGVPTDSSFWISVVFGIVMLLSLVRWRKADVSARFASFLFALVFLWINWWIGSQYTLLATNVKLIADKESVLRGESAIKKIQGIGRLTCPLQRTR